MKRITIRCSEEDMENILKSLTDDDARCLFPDIICDFQSVCYDCLLHNIEFVTTHEVTDI